MNLAPWWEQNPGRLQYEYDALKHAGISYTVDEKASGCGILRLRLEMPYAGERILLIVTFPDLYPYFRFQVDAPDLDLAHHQNPFGKNLCVIGRGTNEWHTTDTVAGLLQQQLPRVIEAGSSDDKKFVAGKEQQQAEPLSEYYGYSESMIVLPGEWQVPGQYDEGTFTVSPFDPQGPFPERFIRGLMTELRSRDGKTLLNSDVTVLNSSKQQPLDGCWLRVQEPIKHCHQKLFLEEMISRSDFARTAPPNRIEGGCVKLWGILFPEEVDWRTEGEGWIFLCVFNVNQTKMIRFDHPMKSPKEPKNKRNNKRKKRN